MNRSSFALLVALLVHLLLLLIFWILGTLTPEIKKPKPEEEKIKISLKDLPKKHKTSGLNKHKPQPQPQKIAPPMPKGKQLKEFVKPSKRYQKPTLNKPRKPSRQKPKPKPKVAPLPPKKPYIPLIEKKKKDLNQTKPKKQDPMAWMFEDKSSQERRVKKQNSERGANVGGTTREMKKLYGSEWGKLTPGQQQYMIDNQEIMRRITQEILNRQARVADLSGINSNSNNIVEFYLHPNGDMSDFRFLKKSGYFRLDDVTEATIRFAYSKYPYPKEKILVRYNVNYILRR